MVATVLFTDTSRAVKSNWLNSYLKKRAKRNRSFFSKKRNISGSDLGKIAMSGKEMYRRSLVLVSFFYH